METALSGKLAAVPLFSPPHKLGDCEHECRFIARHARIDGGGDGKLERRTASQGTSAWVVA